jgi:hypothetical protein
VSIHNLQSSESGFQDYFIETTDGQTRAENKSVTWSDWCTCLKSLSFHALARPSSRYHGSDVPSIFNNDGRTAHSELTESVESETERNKPRYNLGISQKVSGLTCTYSVSRSSLGILPECLCAFILFVYVKALRRADPRPRSLTDYPRFKKLKWNKAFHGCPSGSNRKRDWMTIRQ